ncbi:acetolactate synthase small subunit [Dokdonia genika]|uniref:Acetolactate synthase small subunit n=1 Tax=Dokdonia genika TaxID=308113 RepID=A0ABV9L8Y8_9FLAO
MSEVKTFTVNIYTENNIGLLNRISAIFQRRKINIESLSASESEIDDVFKFIIVVNVTEEQMAKIQGQIERQVEVIKAFYHTDEETIFTESALFKIKSNLLFEEPQIQNIIKESQARIVTVNKDFFVLEKAGRRSEIELVHRELKPFGIMQFTRSGRIAVTKTEMPISTLLQRIEESNEVAFSKDQS